ncbi:MAG: extracellular matrix regulator RemB [Peptococcia bacterium]|jgi:hypothetical protein
MFLHLGSKVSVLKKDIIGIFDYNLIKKSRVTKEFLEIAANEHLIIQEKDVKKIKSFIVATGNIYFSPISADTLQKRVMSYE